MKTAVVLGLAMVLLLIWLAPRHNSAGKQPLPGGESASVSPPTSAPTPLQQAAACAQPPQTGAVPQQPTWTLLAAIAAESDPDRRSEALERAVESVGDAEPAALLDFLAKQDGSAAADLCQRLIRRWAEKDAPLAAVWAGQIPSGPSSRALKQQVAIAWANSDLAAAARWAQTLPDDDSRLATMRSVAYEAARTDPMSALVLAVGLPPTRERDDLLLHAASQWAGADSAAAQAWAARVPDPVLRDRLLAAMTVAAAEQDPAAAATLAATRLAPGAEQDRAAVAIVQRWAQISPPAAAAWVRKFPDTDARQAAVRNLAALTNRLSAAASEPVIP
jgi:hypothetical protein